MYLLAYICMNKYTYIYIQNMSTNISSEGRWTWTSKSITTLIQKPWGVRYNAHSVHCPKHCLLKAAWLLCAESLDMETVRRKHSIANRGVPRTGVMPEWYNVQIYIITT